MSWKCTGLVCMLIALPTISAAGQEQGQVPAGALQDRYRLWLERHVESNGQQQASKSPVPRKDINAWSKQSAELRRLYDDCLKELGANRPHTNQVDFALADLARHGGKLEEAEERLQRVRAWRRKIYGTEHPLALSISRSLATVQSERGEFRDSLAILETTLRTMERFLRPEHPETWMTRYDLALVLYLTGRFKDAEAQFQRVLKSRSLEPNSEEWLRTRLNHALALLRLGRVAEAEKELWDVIEQAAIPFPSNSRLTMAAMHNLALALQLQKRAAEAEKLFRESLEIHRRTLGAEHPVTLGSMHALANSLPEERVAEKAALYDALLATALRVSGEEAFLTCVTKNNLAVFHLHRGTFDKAKELLREVLKASGNNGHGRQLVTEASMRNLAIAHHCTGHYSETKSVLGELLKSIEARGDPGDGDAQGVRQMLRAVQPREGQGLEKGDGTAFADTDMRNHCAVFRAVYRTGPSCGDCLLRPNGPKVLQAWDLVVD